MRKKAAQPQRETDGGNRYGYKANRGRTGKRTAMGEEDQFTKSGINKKEKKKNHEESRHQGDSKPYSDNPELPTFN